MTVVEKEISVLAASDAGMCALWQPEHFAHVTSLDAWEDEVAEDEALMEHIAAGAFVPLNVGGDGAFQVTVRAADPSHREAQYILVSSQPYLLESKGSLTLGGLEQVGSFLDAAARFPVPAGRYAVTVHLIDWKAEPGAVNDDGRPTASALPDFLVILAAENAPAKYRKSVETFDRH